MKAIQSVKNCATYADGFFRNKWRKKTEKNWPTLAHLENRGGVVTV